jgi:hypothetical protein
MKNNKKALINKKVNKRINIRVFKIKFIGFVKGKKKRSVRGENRKI